MAVEAGERACGFTHARKSPRGVRTKAHHEQRRGFEVLDRSVQREPASGAPVVATPRTGRRTTPGVPREKRGR